MAEVEDDDKHDLDRKEINSFNKHWGWFSTVITLAKEDITKINEITTYPLIMVLNFLAYMKDVNNLRERELQKQRILNRR